MDKTHSKKIRKPRLVNKIDRITLMKKMRESIEPRLTLSFYQYYHLSDPQGFRNELFVKLDAMGVMGRIYVANEGINAQISVPTIHFDDLRTLLYSYDWMNGIRLNVAVDDDGKSFFKLKVMVKPKLVADGLEDDSFDVTNKGKHLDARAFNALTSESNTVLVDMRNHYESEVGYFTGALRPNVTTFRASLPIVAELLEEHKDKNIVMYCTGGIRCEKASAYYKHHGFENVFQLEGGIIEYARQVEAQGLDNKFLGVNFVFDERLGERISNDVVSECHQCENPSDRHVNCANDACHLLFIQCETCAALYEHTCSSECQHHMALSAEERAAERLTKTFNGFKFEKGRYRAQEGAKKLH